MDKKVTMQTKGVTQDKDGNYGIWRTVKRVGKIFIRVGETGKDAVERYTKELLSMPISKLTKKAQKRVYENISSKVMDKISTVRTKLEMQGEVITHIYTFNYRYNVMIYDDYSYKILSRKRLK